MVVVLTQIWPFSKYPPEVKKVKPRLYASIDRAVYERLSAPNLAANLDVISVINTALDPGYASVKTCKRLCLKIRGGLQNVQVLCLHIACLCVRHCGEAFSTELAKSELLKEMGRIGDRSRWAATDIQRMVLHLIQEWAFEVKIADFQLMYNYLRSKNAPFEPRDGPMARIFQPYPGMEQQLMQMQRNDAASDTEARPPSQGTTLIGPDLLQPGRSLDIIKSDLEVARGTVALLNEVVDKIEAEQNWEAVKEDYCVEVTDACAAVQKRIEALLQSDLGADGSDETVLASALDVNDLALSALMKRANIAEIADGTREAPEPPAAAATEQEAKEETDANKESEAPPLIDLLDLDYEPDPSMTISNEKVSDPFAHLESNVNEASSTLNPFAEDGSAPAKNEAFFEDDAFAPAIASENVSPQAATVPSSAGNPFADDSSPPKSSQAPRPAALSIPVSNPLASGPYSAPAQSMQQNGAQQFAAPYTSTGHAVFPQSFETNGGAPRRHTLDVFEGLVDVKKKKEDGPPPPRGVAMNQAQSASSSAVQSPSAPGVASAFDAFDSIGS